MPTVPYPRKADPHPSRPSPLPAYKLGNPRTQLFDSFTGQSPEGINNIAGGFNHRSGFQPQLPRVLKGRHNENNHHTIQPPCAVPPGRCGVRGVEPIPVVETTGYIMHPLRGKMQNIPSADAR